MWNKEHGWLKIGGKLGILEVEIIESRFFNFGGRHLSYFHKRTFGFLGTGAQSWRRALQVVGLLDQATPSGCTPRSTNNTNRRGKPSVPTQPDPHPSPSQWQATQANVCYPAIQQVYTTHSLSLPIPVPIPSARHTIPAHHPRQVVSAQSMAVHIHAAVLFGAQAQSQFH